MRFLLLISFFLIAYSDAQAIKQWEERADFGSFGRHRAIGVGIGTKGYLGTGHYNGTGVETYLADWWEYDPATNAWSQVADYPGNNGLGDLGLCAFAIDTVGFIGCGELDDYVLYKYSPQTNNWTQVASPPGLPKFHDTKGFTINNIGYFTDRINNGIYAYDPATDTWTQKSNPPFSISFSYSAFAMGGKGYLKWNTNLWEYDPTLDSWTQKATFPGLARKSSIGFSQYGYGYIVCGYGTSHSLLERAVWQYDPTTDSWKEMPEFPGARRRYSTHFMIGDLAYIGTGTNGTNLNDVWEYNTYGSFEDINQLFDVNVFPNPATTSVTVNADNLKEFEYELIDMNGKSVSKASTTSGSIHINTSFLKAGNYIYRITKNGRILKSDKLILK